MHTPRRELVFHNQMHRSRAGSRRLQSALQVVNRGSSKDEEWLPVVAAAHVPPATRVGSFIVNSGLHRLKFPRHPHWLPSLIIHSRQGWQRLIARGAVSAQQFPGLGYTQSAPALFLTQAR